MRYGPQGEQQTWLSLQNDGTARQTSALQRPAKRLTLAYRLACARAPLEDERAACEKFLAKQREVYAKEKAADARAWADLCQIVLASNAFLYVE